MTQQRIGYGLGLVALALTCATASAAITVLQVEGFTATQYSPVTFGGNTTVVVGGITYTALSSNASITDAHAAAVRDQMVIPASGLITKIYSQYWQDYTNGLGPIGSLGVGIKPAFFGGTGVKVVNQSWIADAGSTTADESARRRIDYQIHREDVVYVTAAATVDTNYYSLLWSSLNGIATAGVQNFDPVSAGTVRKHADLWTDAVHGANDNGASFSAGKTSGYAIALLDRGQTLSMTNSQRHEVVKSLLMTGANKGVSGSAIGVATWTANATSNNNLNTKLGAGQVDLGRSELVLEAGERTISAITGGANLGSSPSINNRNLGWAYDSIGNNASEALVFSLNSSVMDFAATLNWDVSVAETDATHIDTSSSIFADLDLELRRVTFDGSNYSLGSSMGISTLLSASTGDNTEHLYYKGALGPGIYALVVKSNNGNPAATGYGLSFIAVPEPGTLGLLGLGSAGLLLKRRRQGGKS